MALPFTGPCAVGGGLLTDTFLASPFAKPIGGGDSILVCVVSTGHAALAVHNVPTDTEGNTYTLIASFANGMLNGRTSIYLASGVTGGVALQVTGSSTTQCGQYGIVCWPLSGAHTYNGDFVSATGTSTTASAGATSGTPAGAIGFGVVSGRGNSYVFTPSLAGLKRMYHSEQFDNALGQDLYTDFLEATGPFTATWAISGLPIAWGACAFSLSGPTAPALTPPAGLVQPFWSRTNTTNANDDASDFAAYTSIYGFGGWQTVTQDLDSEQAGTHPWSIRSRLMNFRVDVYLKDAGGATCTRTYTWRKNGIDDLLTVTLSGPSSADNTLLSGEDLVHYVDLEPGDRISLHRTGSGGDAAFDVTEWSLDSANEGNRMSGAALINCRTNNGLVYYGAPLTWKGDSTNTGFRQFRADSTGARSLVAFNGAITRVDYGFFLQSHLRTARYAFTFLLDDVEQDGTNGTPITEVALTEADLDRDLTFDVPLQFVVGNWLQVKQAVPTGTALDTTFAMSVAIEAEVDGEFGLSIDWAGFLGGHLGATPTYAGVNRAASIGESEKEARRIGPVSLSRMNVLHTDAFGPLAGPGSGKHLFYRLLKNSATAMEIDLTDDNFYGIVETPVDYVQGDTQVFEFEGSGNPPDMAFIMGLAFAGTLTVCPDRPVITRAA